MQRFNELLAPVLSDLEKRWEPSVEKGLLKITPCTDGLVVSFAGGRKQAITVKRLASRYRLTSNVLHKARVEQLGRLNILKTLWTRNRLSNLVGFKLDRSGKVVGYIEHLADTLDPSDLAYSIEVLARECDRLEFILSGVDVH